MFQISRFNLVFNVFENVEAAAAGLVLSSSSPTPMPSFSMPCIRRPAISVKANWGHSSNIVVVELCQMARARRLVTFHHEPAYDDGRIEQVLGETRRFEEITRDGHAVEVLSAWDGLELML